MNNEPKQLCEKETAALDYVLNIVKDQPLNMLKSKAYQLERQVIFYNEEKEKVKEKEKKQKALLL